MKTKKEIKQMITEILNDDRLSCKTETVFENAPLAFIQYGLEVRLHTLQMILGVKLTKISELRNESK